MKTHLIYIVMLLIAVSGCAKEDDVERIPEVISFSPMFGFEGDEIDINGRNFSEKNAENIVRIGNKQAEVIAASDSQLTVLVPDDVADGIISVQVGTKSGTSQEEFISLINLEKEVSEAMTSSGIPSLTMSVIADNKIYYSNGFGQYDADRSKDADKSTLYVTSSVSKLIVSIAVMQQVDLAKVNVNTDISEYVGFEVRNPKFPDKEITVKMVMEHGSSLSNPAIGEMIDDVFFGQKADSAIALHPTIEDAITPGSSIFMEGIWQNTEPGTVHKNSNYGITLLAYMVEKLSGKHFNDYSRDEILAPLGMMSSSFYFPDINATKDAAIYDASGAVLEPFSFYFYPAGMLRTSAEDWSQLLFMMLNNGSYNGRKILEPSSVEALLDVKYPEGNNLAYDSSIGLVWRQAAGSEGWIGHTGGGLGITHVTELNKEENIAFVIFTNRAGNGAVIGPGGSLYSKVHRWIDQIDLANSNSN